MKCKESWKSIEEEDDAFPDQADPANMRNLIDLQHREMSVNLLSRSDGKVKCKRF